MAKSRGRIVVAAGTNGAGKSSIAGALMAALNLGYFDPDVLAARLIAGGRPREEANAIAWRLGYGTLRDAVDRGGNFAFETTLGGNSIVGELRRALRLGREVHLLYIGLSSPELHIARVRARVARGGHDIPEAKIRERYSKSLANLVTLIGEATTLHVFDNSAETADGVPQAKVVFRMRRRKIVEPPLRKLLAEAPDWAKPLAAAAIQAAAIQAAAIRDRNPALSKK